MQRHSTIQKTVNGICLHSRPNFLCKKIRHSINPVSHLLSPLLLHQLISGMPGQKEKLINVSNMKTYKPLGNMFQKTSEEELQHRLSQGVVTQPCLLKVTCSGLRFLLQIFEALFRCYYSQDSLSSLQTRQHVLSLY